MTWSPMQLKKIAILGPDKPPAYIEFKPGLNVICGASDTGKSFLVETIDFLLGGIKPLRDIPERIGYDRGRFSIIFEDKEIFTLERSVEGGEYNLFYGNLELEEIRKEDKKLKLKHAHSKEDNLSGWLLSKIELLDKRIKKNAQGETQSLSFRNLVHLLIVQEFEIIKSSSPFLTGQYVSKTSEKSVLKLLLTGVDDSALIAKSDSSNANAGVSAKVEIIDQWLDDLLGALEDVGIEKKEAEEQLNRLDASIEFERKKIDKFQEDTNHSISIRRKLFAEKEKLKDRIGEIHELIGKFELLSNHYEVDINRLESIKESGSLFVHQQKASCPLCGTAPEHQHTNESCQGNVEAVVHAAVAEIAKIIRLDKELTKTKSDLQEELNELDKMVVDIEDKYNTIDIEIRKTITPNVDGLQKNFSSLVEKRSEIRKVVEMFKSVEKLEKQKDDLLKDDDISSSTGTLHTNLSKSILDDLAKYVETLLKAWHLPDSDRVYFDESDFDFVINGKPRKSRGKGLRAITHAAVTIGLLEYCKAKSLPHPGFVVLDSPLLSYWKPEGEADNLKGTDVKDKFYEYLVTNHNDCQIIIIENEHPSDSLLNSIAFTDFTRNPQQGRFGFFPLE